MASTTFTAFAEETADSYIVNSDFSDETLDSDILVKEIKTAAINNDANGYHFEKGVAGRSEDDTSLVFDLTLEPGEEDALTVDGIHTGKGTEPRTYEYSAMYDGDFGYGSFIVNWSGLRNILEIRPDGIYATHNNKMTFAAPYTKGEWVDIVLSVGNDNRYNLWVNGVLAISKGAIWSVNTANGGWARIESYTPKNDTEANKNIRFAIDDLKIYDGAYTPEYIYNDNYTSGLIDNKLPAETYGTIVASGIKTAATNNDANGLHVEGGLAGKAADDKAVVFDLTLENGEADTEGEDGIHMSFGPNRTYEYSTLIDGDTGFGNIYARTNAGLYSVLKIKPDGIYYVDGNVQEHLAAPYKKGEWVNIAISFLNGGAYKVWANDKLIASSGLRNGAYITTWNWIRFGSYTAANDSDTPKNVRVAFDDFKVYEGEYSPIKFANKLRYEEKADVALNVMDKIAIAKKSMTAGELVEAMGIINGSAKVFTDATMNTLVADDAAVSEGARVVAVASDNARIDTWEVTYDTSKLVIYSNNYDNNENGLQIINTAGGKESYPTAAIDNAGYAKEGKANIYSVVNAAAETKAEVNIFSEAGTGMMTAAHNTGTWLIGGEKSVMTMEYSFFAGGDISAMSLIGRNHYLDSINVGNNQSNPNGYISADADGNVTVGDKTLGIKKNQWNRIALTVYPDKLAMAIYINGELLTPYSGFYPTYKNRDQFTWKGFSWLRGGITVPAGGSAVLGYDDVEIYYGQYAPETVSLTVEDPYIMDGDIIYVPEDTELLEFISSADYGDATPVVYTDYTCSEVYEDDYITDGNTLVLVSASGKILRNYTLKVLRETGIVKYIGEDEGEIITGACTIKAEYVDTMGENDGLLMLCVYDGDALKTVVFDNDSDNVVEYAISEEEALSVTAKAMLLDGFTNITPLIESAEFININTIE